MSKQSKPWFYKQTNWWMTWLDGKKVKLVKGKANKKAAQDRLNELLYEAAHNPAPGAPQTVASVIEEYLDVARKTLAASTLEVREPYLESFAEAHGWRPTDDCTPYYLEKWVLSNESWKSDWTKNTAVRHIHAAFNWAADRAKIIAKNPFKGFTQRPGAPRRDMTEVEFKAILRGTRSKTNWKRPTPGKRFRQILYFLWFTGCRPSEASKLLWSNVDFDRSLIVLKEHKTSKTQHIPLPRVIPLHPFVVKLLRSIERRNEGKHVFLNHRKRPWDRRTLGQRILRAREVAGVPDEVKLYGTRHAFGTRGIVNGCDVKTLSTLMGHTTTRMTEHYVHLATQHEHLAAAMTRVNARRSSA